MYVPDRREFTRKIARESLNGMFLPRSSISLRAKSRPNLLSAKAVLSANVYDASSLLGPLLRGQEKAP